ncbi:MAG: hypothetical protein CVU89_04090 [Firmicutes bacterium HGW-Firmicutes-14]|jgi:AcrR family transcriptional regulator|nr:MAG: hypothetical protein CVU89_04090 [Firmicutes bacterium HGW-Firmicutes-14]
MDRVIISREQQIKDAAIRVFSKKGFNGATTKEIAREAGVAEGTIFRYFRTKKDILLSLAGPYIVESLKTTLINAAGKSDEAVLTSIIKNRLELIKENIDLARLLFTEAQFHPELRENFTENVVMRAAGVLEKYIDERISSGDFKAVDPRIASRALIGMVGAFVLWKEFLLGDKYISFDEDELIKQLVDIYLTGIRAEEWEGGMGS